MGSSIRDIFRRWSGYYLSLVVPFESRAWQRPERAEGCHRAAKGCAEPDRVTRAIVGGLCDRCGNIGSPQQKVARNGVDIAC